MTTRNRGRSRTNITRRQALQGIGVGMTALTIGCTGKDDPVAETEADLASPSNEDMATSPPDLRAPADLTELPLTPAQLLAGIDAVVVLMMENRSFDHYLGALVGDTKYPGKRRPDGLTGKESNPDPMGNPVTVFRMDNFTPADPPHGWDASHRQ